MGLKKETYSFGSQQSAILFSLYSVHWLNDCKNLPTKRLHKPTMGRRIVAKRKNESEICLIMLGIQSQNRNPPPDTQGKTKQRKFAEPANREGKKMSKTKILD